MRRSRIDRWVGQALWRRTVLASLSQPLTAMQLARRDGLTLDRAGYMLWEMSQAGVVTCLTPRSRHCRVYTLTDDGHRCREWVRKEMNLPVVPLDQPELNWCLYGWCCSRHRSAVIKALDRPMRAVHIRRRARQRDAGLRMSAGNARDVLKVLARRRVARKTVVATGRKGRIRFPLYQLTRQGTLIRDMLLRAESVHQRAFPTDPSPWHDPSVAAGRDAPQGSE